MRTCSFILMALSSSILIQCDEREKIEVNVDGDYYPLQENSTWEYLQEHYSTADESELLWSETVNHFIKGDTILDGMRYKKVMDEYGIVVKVLRKDGNKYYGRNHDLYLGFAKEYLFLDENASLGSSWKHNKISNETEYKVVGINSTHTFNGIEYHHVMELEANYYDLENEEYKLAYTTLHYYAKGVGEIYTYYPSPSLTFTNLTISLLKYIP